MASAVAPWRRGDGTTAPVRDRASSGAAACFGKRARLVEDGRIGSKDRTIRPALRDETHLGGKWPTARKMHFALGKCVEQECLPARFSNRLSKTKRFREAQTLDVAKTLEGVDATAPGINLLKRVAHEDLAGRLGPDDIQDDGISLS